MRDTDLLARYGGEELVLSFFGMSLDDAALDKAKADGRNRVARAIAAETEPDLAEAI